MSRKDNYYVGKSIRILIAIALTFCLLPVSQGSAAKQVNLDQANAAPNRITLDFEDLMDLVEVADHYNSLGLTFTGATILSQGGSLNYLYYPPKTGRNVIYDTSGGTGVITITFDPQKTGTITKVGGYITGNRSITMTAFDSSWNTLGSISTSGPNYDPVGIPNELLEVSSTTAIVHVQFRDGGNTFTIDDFFFENNQTCIITNVPLYKQGSGSLWANDLYGGTSSSPLRIDDDKDGKFDEDPKDGINNDNDVDKNGNQRIDEDTPETIAKWGCGLTSAAMIVSYFGQRQTGRTTDPRELNIWLKANYGYSGVSLKWDKVAEFARDGVGSGVDKGKGIAPMFYSYNSSSAEWTKDDGVVNAYLCKNSPVVLQTFIKREGPPMINYSGGHFLVATGQTAGGGWNINDPGGYNLTQLNMADYDSLRKYSDSPKDLASLSIAIHSPIELLITDPAGRRTGYDPDTGQYIYEIVDATYGVEAIGAQDGTGTRVETRILEIGSPISGVYSIKVMGTGEGYYEIDFTAYDVGGSSSHAWVNGVVNSTSNFIMELDYSKEIGSEIDVTSPPGKIFVPLITR